jgi:CubicO group peptidase (beta-lactamase class C family)
MARRGIGTLALGAVFALALLPNTIAYPEMPQAVANPRQLGFDAARLQRVGQVFQGFVDAKKLPGAVILIARNDKVVFFQAPGFQDREKQIAMTTNSIFRIASMTKPIISVAAMMLVEEGRLDLAASVFQYLPEFKDVQVGVEKRSANSENADLILERPKRPMTVQDLMRHTAGLVYGGFGDGPVHKAYRAANVMDRNQTSVEMVTKLSKLPLAHQPGEVWEYSMATDVLGRIIEVVSGQALDVFVEERITKPLGMESTGFYVRESDVGRLAQPQVDPASGERAAMPDVSVKPRWLSGGGGMVSTPADYLRFAQMTLNGGTWGGTRFLAPSTIALMTSDALPPGIDFSERTKTVAADLAPMPAAGQGFGLGFAVRTAAGRNPLPGSVGTYYWTGAYGTTFWIDPAEKLIGILMIQTPLPESPPYRRAMRYLTYQALLNGSE